MTLAVMLQGTASDVGKACWWRDCAAFFHQDGLRTAPFKSQNMALNSGITPDGKEMGPGADFPGRSGRDRPGCPHEPDFAQAHQRPSSRWS
ncbi:hypothetical protein LN650_06870 [Klebsiella pneumoniae subsp. pneumoniae]|nr:hypothetical protein [Klebsiella pneumoniae subsp. pneumoniae]